MNFDDQDRESSSWWHGLLARALKQAGSLFYHFLAGGGITDFVRQISSGPKPGEPGSSHERLMARICAPARSRSLQQCVYWSGLECGRRSRVLPPSTGEAVLRLLESSQHGCERQKRKRGDAAGEILPIPPLIKEGTQKPPFVKGAARSAGGFGNVAAMKRTFASRINDLLLAGRCRVRARRCPSVPTEAIFPTLQTLGPLSPGGTGRRPVRSRAGCATREGQGEGTFDCRLGGRNPSARSRA